MTQDAGAARPAREGREVRGWRRPAREEERRHWLGTSTAVVRKRPGGLYGRLPVSCGGRVHQPVEGPPPQLYMSIFLVGAAVHCSE
jgi:hypothetical protein